MRIYSRTRLRSAVSATPGPRGTAGVARAWRLKLPNTSDLLRRFAAVAVGLALAVFLASTAHTQTPAPAAPPASTSIVVASPTYVSIPMEITVNRPAAEVWKRIGGYCAIAEWFQIPNCTITQGKDGEFGAVRSVANEVLVGKTELSYTYTQPVREGRPYNLYHGTLEARPLTATTSKLVYTLVYDNSMLPDDGAKEKDKAQRTATFTRALQNMKTLAEGGTLPPPPPRGGGAGAPAGAPAGGGRAN